MFFFYFNAASCEPQETANNDMKLTKKQYNGEAIIED